MKKNTKNTKVITNLDKERINKNTKTKKTTKTKKVTKTANTNSTATTKAKALTDNEILNSSGNKELKKKVLMKLMTESNAPITPLSGCEKEAVEGQTLFTVNGANGANGVNAVNGANDNTQIKPLNKFIYDTTHDIIHNPLATVDDKLDATYALKEQSEKEAVKRVNEKRSLEEEGYQKALSALSEAKRRNRESEAKRRNRELFRENNEPDQFIADVAEEIEIESVKEKDDVNFFKENPIHGMVSSVFQNELQLNLLKSFNKKQHEEIRKSKLYKSIFFLINASMFISFMPIAVVLFSAWCLILRINPKKTILKLRGISRTFAQIVINTWVDKKIQKLYKKLKNERK